MIFISVPLNEGPDNLLTFFFFFLLFFYYYFIEIADPRELNPGWVGGAT
jgi:hypothetical protein